MSKIHTVVLVFLSTCVFAQKTARESIPFEKPPTIDGKMDDWTAEWWLDPDGKFLSNVGNDAENLYFRLKISDDLTQQKIGLFGLTLRLNTKGKRKGKVGLKYPIGKDKSELKKENSRPGIITDERAWRTQKKKDWVSDVEVVELIGLSKKNIVSSRLGLANGIEAIIVAEEDGSYIYEARVPFKAFGIMKNVTPILGVEFETGRLVLDAKNQAILFFFLWNKFLQRNAFGCLFHGNDLIILGFQF